jgi:hypothetical protein
MKKSREKDEQIRGITAAALAAAALALAGGACAQGPDGIPSAAKAGTMELVQGDVRVIDAHGERALAPGDAIAPADKVVTGTNGAASMVLRDGTTMMVGPKSRVDLNAFTYNSTTQEGGLLVSVLRGSMRMITGLISKSNPQAVAVTTRTATIGVRGTDFIVEVDEEGS